MKNTRKSKEVAPVKKRSGLLLKLAVLIVVVWMAVGVVRLHIEISDAEQQRAAVQLDIARKKRDNAMLSELLEKSDDLERIVEAARDELGYVSSNEQIFYDVSG